MEVTYESEGNLDDETDRSDFAYVNEEGASGKSSPSGYLDKEISTSNSEKLQGEM